MASSPFHSLPLIGAPDLGLAMVQWALKKLIEETHEMKHEG